MIVKELRQQRISIIDPEILILQQGAGQFLFSQDKSKLLLSTSII
jgi:hypothetical protein